MDATTAHVGPSAAASVAGEARSGRRGGAAFWLDVKIVLLTVQYLPMLLV